MSDICIVRTTNSKSRREYNRTCKATRRIMTSELVEKFHQRVRILQFVHVPECNNNDNFNNERERKNDDDAGPVFGKGVKIVYFYTCAVRTHEIYV